MRSRCTTSAEAWRRILAGTALLVAAAATATSTSAAPRWHTPSIRMEVVRPLGVPPAAAERLLVAAREAAASWAATCTSARLDVVPAPTRAHGAAPDERNTVVVLSRAWCRGGRASGPCHRRTDLAVTSLLDGEGESYGQIAEADIEINGVTFDWFGVGAGTRPPIALATVLAHEMGHVLGLEHPEEPGEGGAAPVASIMVARVHAGHAGPVLPTDADRAALCALYPAPPTVARPDTRAPSPATDAADISAPAVFAAAALGGTIVVKLLGRRRSVVAAKRTGSRSSPVEEPR